MLYCSYSAHLHLSFLYLLKIHVEQICLGIHFFSQLFFLISSSASLTVRVVDFPSRCFNTDPLLHIYIVELRVIVPISNSRTGTSRSITADHCWSSYSRCLAAGIKYRVRLDRERHSETLAKMLQLRKQTESCRLGWCTWKGSIYKYINKYVYGTGTCTRRFFS